MDHDLTDEAVHDRARRTFLRLAGATAVTVPLWTSAPAVAAEPGPIVKPLPADKFFVYGTNAETRWEALAGVGDLVPIDRFFVRNHTRTPLLSADSWRSELFGTGLRGAPTADRSVVFTDQDLVKLPAETITARIECAGNGRSLYTTQQHQTVSGTSWLLGAVGVARWRGVRLSTVLKRAGLRASAVDLLPQGLDPDYVTGGVNLGPVRRPFELLRNGTLAAGRTHRLHGRSWSGTGGIRKVEVSTDGGRTWRHTTPHGRQHGWARWSVPWRPSGPNHPITVA